MRKFDQQHRLHSSPKYPSTSENKINDDLYKIRRQRLNDNYLLHMQHQIEQNVLIGKAKFGVLMQSFYNKLNGQI